MGTRHLIAVQVDGKYKIAQYGQWDGYPSGQGVTALAFCQTIVDSDCRSAFADKCRATVFMTDEDVERIFAELEAGTASLREGGKYEQLSRDRGAEILDIVSKADPGILLRDSSSFAGESLMCEYAYVIDLDKGTFEVFKGFNKDKLDPSERFASAPVDVETNERMNWNYQPVKHIKTYQLDALPSEDEFLAELEPQEDEEATA